MKIRRADVQESELLSQIARDAKAHWGYRDEDLAAWQADLTVSRESVAELPTSIAELARFAPAQGPRPLRGKR